MKQDKIMSSICKGCNKPASLVTRDTMRDPYEPDFIWHVVCYYDQNLPKPNRSNS